MEKIRLWRSGRKKLLGYVILDNGHLLFEFDDDREQDQVQKVFDRTGAITWGWTQFEREEPIEQRAEPRTPDWLWFVVANILHPMGYQADFGITE